MTVNDNLLEGELPDAFQSLTSLVNIDISSNNLSGQLPPSMRDLSVLTKLNMRNNHLSGVLDVLSDLPLVDLNVENNHFSGPIPPKLLTIPNFRKDGNQFNTSVLPSTSPASPPIIPVSFAPAPSVSTRSKDINPIRKKEGKTILKVIAYVVIAIASFVMVVLGVSICISKLKKKAEEDPQIMKHDKLMSINSSDSNLPTAIINSVPEDAIEKPKEHTINMTGSSAIRISHPFEYPKLGSRKIQIVGPKISISPSVTSFSVALLQQYTKSFTEENLICDDSVSKIYLAELPDGKLLTVMNLDNANLNIQAEDFLDFISVISNLHSPYIIELVGYCMEYEQRVLVYSYFSETTLHDILHCEDEFKKNLSWYARIEIELGAARALEYLHESCHPPVAHKIFNSSKIFVDKCMNVRVSDCGLASLSTSIHNS